MVRESKMYMGQAMNIQSYRHIAIAIGQYWYREWQPINPDQKDDSNAMYMRPSITTVILI